MENSFTAKIERFETQGGWYFVPVPRELILPLEDYASNFGYIPIEAKVGGTNWPTSLLPKGDGSYFVALPQKVRSKEKLFLGTEIELSFAIRAKKGK